MSAPATDSPARAASPAATGAASPSTAPAAAAPAASQEHPIAQAIQATPQDLGHKVFVGNLPFSVTDDSIKEIFGKVGQVTEAQIIHRGTRSLGYGFVTYTNEADAASAVSQLDKSEISGRQVNVEVAKPMPAPGAVAARAAKKAAEVGATRATAQEAQQDGVDADGALKPKKARKPRKPRGPRQPRLDDETEEAGDAPAAAGTTTSAVSDAADALAPGADGERAARKPRNRKRKGAAAVAGLVAEGEEGAPPALGEATNKTGAAAAAARQPRRRGPPAGVASSTLVFVGNLNFSVTNESLAAAFAPDCSVKSAVVVVRKFGQSAGRSKGFAFVDFASAEDQQRALERFQGKELEGRPMSLKVAIQPEEGFKGAKQAADHAAAGGGDDEQTGRTEGDAIIVAS
ncbi:hypothetical protein JCM10449v2_004145 [Rhodotorula kratochvilovae]